MRSPSARDVDSTARVKVPFPQCANPPRGWSEPGSKSVEPFIRRGGDQPQGLVNEFAELIFKGETKAVLLAGARPGGHEGRGAQTDGAQLEPAGDGEMEDRGLGKRLLSITKSPTASGFPPRRIPSSSTLSRHALDWVARPTRR